MFRALLPLALAPLLASCQPPDLFVRAAFLGNALAFVAADPGDSESLHCWHEGAVIDDRLKPLWRFGEAGAADCGDLFPLYYGRAPDGTETLTGPGRLETGRIYVLIGRAGADVYGAFSLTRSGNLWIVHNVDPDSFPATSLRQAWWDRRVDGTPH